MCNLIINHSIFAIPSKDVPLTLNDRWFPILIATNNHRYNKRMMTKKPVYMMRCASIIAI